MKNLPIKLIFLTILSSLSLTLNAHEFWLEAHPFYQKAGKKVEISVHVGENMKGGLLPNIPAWYKEFDVITSSGLQEVDGEMGRDPAGVFSQHIEGVYAVGYKSSKNTVELNAELFTQYLKDEGLEKIITQREQLNESQKNGREIYSRNVKTLVKIGETNQVNFYNHDFSYPLNITPMSDPYQLKIGDTLKVHVTYNQVSAANLLVKAQIKHQPDLSYQTRTDDSGMAHIPINHSGLWLISTVDMQRSDYDDIDWESFWSSMTFEIKK